LTTIEACLDLPTGDFPLKHEDNTLKQEEDQGGDMVAFVDPRTKDIIECNDHLVESTGYQKSTLIGRDIFTLYTKQCQPNAIAIFKIFLKDGKVVEKDLRLKKRGKGSIPVTLRLSGSQDYRGRMRCTRFSFHNISKRKKFQERILDEKQNLENKLITRTQDLRQTKQIIRKEVKKRKSAETKIHYALRLLQRQHRKLRTLAGQLLSIQEEERRRLSRELHDDTCQKLAMLAFQAETLAQRYPTSQKEATKQLKLFHQQITEVAGEVRTFAHHLHPSILEHLGLVQALEAYIEEFTKPQDINITFSHKNISKNLPMNLALCLYRVTQECLANTAKHANAQEAWVTLTGFPKSIRLSIRDNGKGFSKQKLKTFQQGLGFVSMVERTRFVKGKLDIQSRANQGTQVILKIPTA
jgi:PAS domain S-box-containing protein